MNTFPKWLKKQIKNKKLSQAEFAKAIKVSEASVSRLLSGERKPKAATAYKIAKALIIPPDEVFTALGIIEKNDQSDFKLISHKLSYLDKDQQRLVIDFIDMLIERKNQTTKGL